MKSELKCGYKVMQYAEVSWNLNYNDSLLRLPVTYIV
jgi:hypothetical protein